mgnify:CR=1 FL=1
MQEEHALLVQEQLISLHKKHIFHLQVNKNPLVQDEHILLVDEEQHLLVHE